MAAKTIALAFVPLVLSIVLAGCILPPQEEAPLITTSKSFVLTQEKAERFRIAQGSSTPEYSIRAVSILNRTALLIINPGSIAVGLTEGDHEPVDLNGDGNADIVLAMANTTSAEAYITIHIPGASQVCATKCPIGQKQRQFPDCSCYSAQECPSACPSGQLQHPYPDCTCYTENRTCTDGTVYGQCSETKPMFCNNGVLVSRCSSCGCPAGMSCNSTSGACYTTSQATPTPTPSATPTPAQDEMLQAIAVANSSTEGQLMSRFDALYRKNPSCTQSEFISTFHLKKGRDPNQNELLLFANTKNYIPASVAVNATRNGTVFTIIYTNVGVVRVDALKVVVASGAVVSRQWLDGTDTSLNQQLIAKAEAIPGNCGMVMAINGWA